jgi:hypothetical protein
MNIQPAISARDTRHVLGHVPLYNEAYRRLC